jgi:hypothetical protein
MAYAQKTVMVEALVSIFFYLMFKILQESKPIKLKYFNFNVFGMLQSQRKYIVS